MRLFQCCLPLTEIRVRILSPELLILCNNNNIICFTIAHRVTMIEVMTLPVNIWEMPQSNISHKPNYLKVYT